MRKLICFTLGFTAACALCAYIHCREVFLPLLICVALAGVTTAMIGREQPWLRRAALVLLGTVLGLVWFAAYDWGYLKTPASWEEAPRRITVRTSDHSWETGYGTAVDGWTEIGEKPYQIRLYLQETEPIPAGSVLTGQFRLKRTIPEGKAESLYHQGKGIFLLGYQTEEMQIQKTESTWREFPARLRLQIKAILDRWFPEDAAAFAKALLLGDASGLGYETDTDFQICGIRHVIAVSGLHVSILFALVSTITLRRRWLTALAGFPVLALFAAVAGFTPSVTRACIMSALMLLALLEEKEYDGPTALAFAVLVMLTANPLTITSVSFQLSAVSVAGIFLFQPRISRWILSVTGEVKERNLRNILLKWFASSVSVTISAMSLTTPLCAYYFGMVSLVSVLTNLLTLWVISFVFYGLMAVCLLHGIWAAGAAVLAKIITLPIRYVLMVAEVMADFPLAAVYTCSPYICFWLIFVYLLLGVFVLSKNRKPGVLACCICLGLCGALLASWAEPLASDTRFTVLDVGQGQCLLMQYKGKNVMIDCGGDSDADAADTAAEYLLSQGIGKLDVLILTHMDRDHAGGAENLLKRIDTDLLILPPTAEATVSFAEENRIYAAEDLSLDMGDGKIKIYPPNFPGNSNEMSLCILFETEKCVILVTGDRSGFGERMLLHAGDIPDVDILVAGHHGSKHSTCEQLLAAVRPEIVCISVGADNSYGHPARELLERLNLYGCTVRRTDVHGTILIRR